MLYSANRQSIVLTSGLQIELKYEAESLDVEELKERLQPVKQVSTHVFSRPKRPSKNR